MGGRRPKFAPLTTTRDAAPGVVPPIKQSAARPFLSIYVSHGSFASRNAYKAQLFGGDTSTEREAAVGSPATAPEGVVVVFGPSFFTSTH